MGNFAVIDVETTGLNPYRHDRIVEIAALLVSKEGAVVSEFTSLVNPERDVGPTHIHGLSAADVLQAPLFSEVATPLLELLRPSVALVAHNIRFDLAFLDLEFRRLGVAFPKCQVVDTMHLSGGGTLSACCANHGIGIEGRAHSAANDVQAVARLLFALLQESPTLSTDFMVLPPIAWPVLLLPTRNPLRRDEARQWQSHAPTYIQNLVSRLPPVAAPATDLGASMAYVDLLGRALEDRHIEDDEGQSLVEVALQWGLTFDQIKAIHADYLRRLVKTACADGVVTTKEQEDLLLVARLLGFEEINQGQLESLIHSVAHDNTQETLASPGADALRGKRVCFTGEAQCRLNGTTISREMATSLAERHGLTVVDSVTKTLDILVVADPLTQSGKAKKARQYGLRIVHEPEFWRMLGIATE
jgi:DNA polymerase III subunit epsilon